jgi:AcrR family transcriptional regulator
VTTSTLPRRVGRPRRDAHDPAVNTREAILVAAARLFSRHGYRGVRLNQIAEAAGLSTPALYYYFTDKSDILQALGAFSLGRTLEVTRRLLDQGGSPGVALFLVLWFHASRSMLNPYDMWYEVQFAGGDDEGEFAGDYRLWRDLLKTLIRDGVGRGEFRDIADVVALNLIIGAIYGVKELQRTERIKDPEALADFVIAGLAAGDRAAASIRAQARRQRSQWQDLIVGHA